MVLDRPDHPADRWWAAEKLEAYRWGPKLDPNFNRENGLFQNVLVEKK
jgi:hypothetical protein